MCNRGLNVQIVRLPSAALQRLLLVFDQCAAAAIPIPALGARFLSYIAP
jgi:hypothetical protein